MLRPARLPPRPVDLRNAMPRYSHVVPTEKFRVDRASPRRARAFAETVLRNARVDDTTRETVRLLVSEVVTNAVLHARSDVEVSVGVHATHVRVEVEDESSDAPMLRHPEPMSATGRGLQFLEQLASRWGWNGSEGGRPGKQVWFEVSRLDAVSTSA